MAQARGCDHADRARPRQRPDPPSKMSRAALAERAHWLTVEWLPKYAPELNDIEGLWRDLSGIIALTRPSPARMASTAPSMKPS